ncbi:MAG: hypothetical protein H7A32_01995 [Deltaproteobacteria bacterium]|nr:hypothetical protein [Deltaproteobacteria bacterium]
MGKEGASGIKASNVAEVYNSNPINSQQDNVSSQWQLPTSADMEDTQVPQNRSQNVSQNSNAEMLAQSQQITAFAKTFLSEAQSAAKVLRGVFSNPSLEDVFKDIQSPQERQAFIAQRMEIALKEGDAEGFQKLLSLQLGRVKSDAHQLEVFLSALAYISSSLSGHTAYPFYEAVFAKSLPLAEQVISRMGTSGENARAIMKATELCAQAASFYHHRAQFDKAGHYAQLAQETSEIIGEWADWKSPRQPDHSFQNLAWAESVLEMRRIHLEHGSQKNMFDVAEKARVLNDYFKDIQKFRTRIESELDSKPDQAFNLGVHLPALSKFSQSLSDYRRLAESMGLDLKKAEFKAPLDDEKARFEDLMIPLLLTQLQKDKILTAENRQQIENRLRQRVHKSLEESDTWIQNLSSIALLQFVQLNDLAMQVEASGESPETAMLFYAQAGMKEEFLESAENYIRQLEEAHDGSEDYELELAKIKWYLSTELYPQLGLRQEASELLAEVQVTQSEGLMARQLGHLTSAAEAESGVNPEESIASLMEVIAESAISGEVNDLTLAAMDQLEANLSQLRQTRHQDQLSWLHVALTERVAHYETLGDHPQSSSLKKEIEEAFPQLQLALERGDYANLYSAVYQSRFLDNYPQIKAILLQSGEIEYQEVEAEFSEGPAYQIPESRTGIASFLWETRDELLPEEEYGKFLSQLGYDYRNLSFFQSAASIGYETQDENLVEEAQDAQMWSAAMRELRSWTVLLADSPRDGINGVLGWAPLGFASKSLKVTKIVRGASVLEDFSVHLLSHLAQKHRGLALASRYVAYNSLAHSAVGVPAYLLGQSMTSKPFDQTWSAESVTGATLTALATSGLLNSWVILRAARQGLATPAQQALFQLRREIGNQAANHWNHIARTSGASAILGGEEISALFNHARGLPTRAGLTMGQIEARLMQRVFEDRVMSEMGNALGMSALSAIGMSMGGRATELVFSENAQAPFGLHAVSGFFMGGMIYLQGGTYLQERGFLTPVDFIKRNYLPAAESPYRSSSPARHALAPDLSPAYAQADLPMLNRPSRFSRSVVPANGFSPSLGVMASAATFLFPTEVLAGDSAIAQSSTLPYVIGGGLLLLGIGAAAFYYKGKKSGQKTKEVSASDSTSVEMNRDGVSFPNETEISGAIVTDSGAIADGPGGEVSGSRVLGIITRGPTVKTPVVERGFISEQSIVSGQFSAESSLEMRVDPADHEEFFLRAISLCTDFLRGPLREDLRDILNSQDPKWNSLKSDVDDFLGGLKKLSFIMDKYYQKLGIDSRPDYQFPVGLFTSAMDSGMMDSLAGELVDAVTDITGSKIYGMLQQYTQALERAKHAAWPLEAILLSEQVQGRIKYQRIETDLVNLSDGVEDIIDDNAALYFARLPAKSLVKYEIEVASFEDAETLMTKLEGADRHQPFSIYLLENKYNEIAELRSASFRVSTFKHQTEEELYNDSPRKLQNHEIEIHFKLSEAGKKKAAQNNRIDILVTEYAVAEAFQQRASLPKQSDMRSIYKAEGDRLSRESEPMYDRLPTHMSAEEIKEWADSVGDRVNELRAKRDDVKMRLISRPNDLELKSQLKELNREFYAMSRLWVKLTNLLMTYQAGEN